MPPSATALDEADRPLVSPGLVPAAGASIEETGVPYVKEPRPQMGDRYNGLYRAAGLAEPIVGVVRARMHAQL